MNFAACSFKQSTLIHGIRSSSRDLVNSRIKPNSCASKLVFTTDFDGFGRGSRFRKSVVGGLGGLAQCKGQDNAGIVNPDGNKYDGLSSRQEDVSLSQSGHFGGVEELREKLYIALWLLKLAQLNNIMSVEKAQELSETAIALKDHAKYVGVSVDSVIVMIEEMVNLEQNAKEAVHKETTGNVSLERTTCGDSQNGSEDQVVKGKKVLLLAQEALKKCKVAFEDSKAELMQLQQEKMELRRALDIFTLMVLDPDNEDILSDLEMGERLKYKDLQEVVRCQRQAAQRVYEAKLALQQAEECLLFLCQSQEEFKNCKLSLENCEEAELIQLQKKKEELQGDLDRLAEISVDPDNDDILADLEIGSQLKYQDLKKVVCCEAEKHLSSSQVAITEDKGSKPSLDGLMDDGAPFSDDLTDKETGKLDIEDIRAVEETPTRATNIEREKAMNAAQSKKVETHKDIAPDNSASSTRNDGKEFKPASVFHGLMDSAKKHMPELIVGFVLLVAGVTHYMNRADTGSQLLQQPDVITTSMEEVPSSTKPLIRHMQKHAQASKKAD